MKNKPKIFISYSHKDEAWKDRLVSHLGVLAKQGTLEVWDDRRIAAGDDWQTEIEQAIETCHIAVLLISADFLASDFILGLGRCRQIRAGERMAQPAPTRQLPRRATGLWRIIIWKHASCK